MIWVAIMIVSGGGPFLAFMLAFGPGFLAVAAFAVGMLLHHHGVALSAGDRVRAGPALAWSTMTAGFFGFPAVYLSRWFADVHSDQRVLVWASQGICAGLTLLAIVAIASLLIAHWRRFPWFTATAGAFAFDVILIRRPGSDQGWTMVLIAFAMIAGVFWTLKFLDWLAQPRYQARALVRDPLATSIMRFGYSALLLLVAGITFPAWQASTSPPSSPPWILVMVLPVSAAMGFMSMRRAGRWRVGHESVALEPAVRRSLFAGIAAAAISGFLFFSYLFSLAR